MARSSWFGWLRRELLGPSTGQAPGAEEVHYLDTTGEELAHDRVVEAIARQRAHAEEALSRTVVTAERLPELGRRMACQEIAKHLQIEEEVWTRAVRLAHRGMQNRPRAR